MLHRTKVLLAIIAAIFLVTSYWGCNRITHTTVENAPPEVHFVNVPQNADTFNFAPVVRWYGYDSDGLVDAFQYHDDYDTAAVNAYLACDAPLQHYIDGLPPSAWVTTYSNSDTIYLRRAEDSTITQHVFMVRCVDNLGAISQVKVRTFFRTNNPPNPPLVKWALDGTLTNLAGESGAKDYQRHYVMDHATQPDSLFWGDTLTSTYGGIGFLWKGTDPDSRALNVIPLTFSYRLTNTTTGQIFPYPVMDDSNHVIGYRQDWSPWLPDAQVTYSAANTLALNPNFVLDGHYVFEVRVRDDGLTEADSTAIAEFDAVGAVNKNDLLPNQEHNFERQLLIVDWTAQPRSGPDTTNFGLINGQVITDFYNAVVPQGLRLAEQIREVSAPGLYPDPIGDTFDWYLDQDVSQPAIAHRVPFDLIRHYKWVWVIQDNMLVSIPPANAAQERLRVLADYMDVGGQVCFSGRGLFRTFGISGPKTLDPTATNERFLRDYFNLSTVVPKPLYATNPTSPTDFSGATTTDRFLPGLDVDTAFVHHTAFGSTHQRFNCLPEIEYFGRSGGTAGNDYTVSLYNYYSCSAGANDSAFHAPCHVISSTTSHAYLSPAVGMTRVLLVDTVYNVTKGIYGQFVRVDPPAAVNGDWRILVSIPADHGPWLTTDSLSVNYTFIPTQPSHDQPTATGYIRFQNQVTYNRFRNEYEIDLAARFRSAFFTFPLSFMNNDVVPEWGVGKIAVVVADQALIFNSSRITRTSFGTGGSPRP